ncbi:hypothetical protein TraAM80_05886 [Trypanosoma rangeli]|uniref:Uncharacterized protein n=1 Tax=Trypanosoma rangeli TaxID=5698 RepID=A0A422NCP6_TRYRA|nr:uncharacterized protein TraAM80_05886 [Trypanosoma rangeli]RNF03206.1 hypothetical protein TraAM80_05886 [Trypanosoma rangeli]|eukprot:RNF03206.1 hypothetical protein TraAM80_05886 [Trypanosoma rangeli]
MIDKQGRMLTLGSDADVSASCSPQYKFVDSEENGFQDLVPTSLAELTANEEVHTAHLVEGDFFPEESSAPAELQSGEDRNDASTNLLQESSPLSARSPPEKRVPYDNNGNTGSEVRSLSFPETRRSVKRVRWADEVDTGMPLVRRATTFLLLHIDKEQQQQQQPQQVIDLDKVSQALSPPPVLRQEKNGDGRIYLSCKALRPARRFVLWKRSNGASDAVAEEFPFKLQPPGSSSTRHTATLLAALHPPYQAEHVGPAVLMRSATIAQSAKKGEALCDGGLQMPMVRPSQLRNVPLHILL